MIDLRGEISREAIKFGVRNRAAGFFAAFPNGRARFLGRRGSGVLVATVGLAIAVRRVNVFL